jgi:hypothetical protein
MTPKYFLVCVFQVAINLPLIAQTSTSFLDAFDAISDQPIFLLSDEITTDIPEGGHLQGIQVSGNKIFISGSSNEYGYVSIFKGNQTSLEFIGIKQLSEKPYTHAGGIQISNQWLAVGCEDSEGKETSLVVLQDVSNGSAIAGKPTYVLKREGKKKLATAGAVALLKRKDHFLLAVASWDAATIDFYSSNHTYPSKEDFEFKQWTTWDRETSRHKGWIDKKSPAYQNIQLFEDSCGIFIVGMGMNNKGQHVADVYSVEAEKDKYDMLTKVRSRTFKLPGSASFRNGSGIVKDGPKTFVAMFPTTL